MDPDVVHVETVRAGRQRRAGTPDGFQALRQGTFNMGQSGDPSRLVAGHGRLAHLGHGDEALVVGILPADAVQQNDILGRFEPREGEIAQAPEVQATPDHRVHIADGEVLNQRAILLRAERDIADFGRCVAHETDGDPTQAVHEGQLRELRGDRRRGRVGVARQVGREDVDIDDAFAVTIDRLDLCRQRAGQSAIRHQLRQLSKGGDQVGRTAVEGIVRARERP